MTEDAREALYQAGELLFARDGIDRVRLRELNELAGQKNPSALHYHFGSRDGLVQAILVRHQESIEAAMVAGLDALEAAGEVTIRDIVATTVRPLVAKLDSTSGRNFLRIIPQVTPMLGRNLRQGVLAPNPPQSVRALELMRRRMGHVSEAVQRERQVGYVLMLTTLLADRAHQIEAGEPTPLDRDAFEAHVVDMIAAALEAPSTV